MKKTITLLFAVSFSCILSAQLIVSTIGSPETIDFTGFDGSGFSTGPSDGQLNSNTWSVIGFSYGDLLFGDEGTTDDFARGSTSGFETTGGIYGVDIFGDQALMVQPTADDFTPGSFILKIENNSGTVIGQFDLAYDIYVLNDQGRSNSFNFSYSYDNITYTDVTDMDYNSPEASDFSPYLENKSYSLTGIAIADGDFFYVRWTGDDVSGAGNRDEFALDNISFTAQEGAGVPTYSFSPASLTVAEPAGVAYYDVTLSESADCVFNVGYTEVTADLPTDFGFTLFTVEFTEGGPTTQTIDVGIVDDIEDELTESFIIYYTVSSGTCVAGAVDEIEIFIEDDDLAGTAGASFSEAGFTGDESAGTFSVFIELTEEADCELSVTLDGATTMTETDDYILDLPILLTFNVGGSTIQLFDVVINNDIETEPSETLIMNLNVLSGTCSLLSPSGFDILINDNDAPIYTVVDIADVHGEDADGVCTNIGDLVSITGIVYGINLWDGGLQFTVIDETAGISVFNFDNTFGYTVTEGDEVTVNGEIDQFNGLTEIIADTLIFVSGGNSLNDSNLVSELNEETESAYIYAEGLDYVDVSQWLGDGSSFNVEFTDGFNIFVVRIDNNTEYSISGPPSFIDGTYIVKGIGTQFDTDLPYTSGYQIMPMHEGDIVGASSINEINMFVFNLYPNPAIDNINIESEEVVESLEIINQIGEVVNFVSINALQKTIDVKELPAGFYAVKIKTASGVYSSNFIKE
ncbi:MAG: T9SS type A sorting domain-containing protein [Fimbriimonadaceae bacterium]|nr:T9SS type A sorting domain-containing protein [Chitinophagales bacterium]